MATFSDDPSELERLDWQLLQDGPITLYLRRAALDPDVAWLRERAYTVVAFDCLRWGEEKDMHEAMAETLSFPDYYGMNLDALNDCMTDVSVPVEGGLALVFLRFDAFASRQRRVAQALLDILAQSARRSLLFGRRLLVLVQSDDPRLAFEPVGAMEVGWNRKEWLDESRGV